MANEKTILDSIEVKDLEDGSTLVVTIFSCTELGNNGLPGLQVAYLGYLVNFEPLIVEKWAYQAKKAGTTTFLLEDHSWNVHPNQYVRNYLLLGPELKIRIEVKTRSRESPVVRDYDLPFKLEA